MSGTLVKNITIVGGDTREIGAEAQNVIVSYNSNDEIIEDIHAPGVVVDHTKTLPEALSDSGVPESHADPTDKYGPGDTVNYGHIKLGTGLERNLVSGATDVKYGTTAGTAAEGNDSRLSDARKNPQAISFSVGSGMVPTKSYDGSSAVNIIYSDIGAAPTNHASSSTTYGIATKDNYGHIKAGEGIAISSGVAKINVDNDTIIYNSSNDTISAKTITDTLSINKGGTGAVTAADARDNLGLTNKLAVKNGTEISLVVTGEKYDWNNPNFTEASTRDNIVSEESTSTLWGKVKKWFSDLKNGAFIDTYISDPVACVTGDTTCTITDSHITVDSIIEPICDLTTPINCRTIVTTDGQTVLTFKALTNAANFKVRITN